MIDKIIESILNPINLFFILIIIILALIELIQKKDFKSIIVSIGVLGTFVGIFLGLLDFDTHNLKGSIENILKGLKTAFITSIIGMGSAILLSIIEKYTIPYSNEESKELFILENLLNEIKLEKDLLNKILDSNREIINLSNESNNNINNSLSIISSKLDSIILEIQQFSKTSLENYNTLINNLNKDFDKLNNSLSLAIEHLSKGATEEIIKALKEVIENFNEELQTQFGENFVALNQAVINLVNWQENYKSYIEETEQLLKELLESNKNLTNNFEKIKDYQSQLNNIYQSLEEIIKTTNYQIEELNRNLQTYKNLSDKSKEMFENLEKINNKFNHLTDNISHQTQKQEQIITEFIKNSTQEVINNIKTNQEELNIIINHFKQIEQEIPKALEISLENLNKGLAALTRKFKEDYEEILNKYKQNIDTGV